MKRKLANDELERKTIGEYHEAEKLPLVIILDNIRSMHNVGSVFRSSDAFLVSRIILTGITARPPHREIQKTALGATESVSWSYEKSSGDAIRKLKKEGYRIIAIEQVENSISLETFVPDPSEKYGLVFGNEVFGVDQEIVNLSDVSVEIPQFGTKHSFNISVSAGIVLWEFARKMRLQESV